MHSRIMEFLRGESLVGEVSRQACFLSAEKAKMVSSSNSS